MLSNGLQFDILRALLMLMMNNYDLNITGLAYSIQNTNILAGTTLPTVLISKDQFRVNIIEILFSAIHQMQLVKCMHSHMIAPQ